MRWPEHRIPGTVKRELRVVETFGAPGDEGYFAGPGSTEPVTEDLGKATVLTSLPARRNTCDTHYPVIDIDVPCTLIPSSTPGHFHLLIDKAMTFDQYTNLLHVLVEAEVVEHGYARAVEVQGYGSIRLPWIKKVARK